METSDVCSVVDGVKTNQVICDDMLSSPNEEEAADKKVRLKFIQKDLGITAEEAEEFFG